MPWGFFSNTIDFLLSIAFFYRSAIFREELLYFLLPPFSRACSSSAFSDHGLWSTPQLLLKLHGTLFYFYLWLQGWEKSEKKIIGQKSPHDPLSVLFSATQIEDGGKAALSQKMRTGDELVNINGTPLYGSRQEALILIKGSFRILKLIVRR